VNGSPNSIGNGSSPGAFSSIAVSGSTAYMAGTLDNLSFSDGFSIILYSSGLPLTYSITPPLYEYNYASALSVDGQDLYVAGGTGGVISGKIYTRAHCWKNGVDSLLSYGSDQSLNSATGLLIRH
jgi:hypothetical protein